MLAMTSSVSQTRFTLRCRQFYRAYDYIESLLSHVSSAAWTTCEAQCNVNLFCLYAFQLNTEDFVYENVYKGSLVEVQCTVSSCFGFLEMKRAWQMEEVSATPALTCGKLFCTCYTHYVRECETVKFTVSLGSFFNWIPLLFRMPSFHI